MHELVSYASALKERSGHKALIAIIIFLLVIIVWPHICSASITLLEKGQSSLSLNPKMEVLRDPSGRLTINDVAAPDADRLFTPLTGRFSAGYTKDVVWLRFTLQRSGPDSPEIWWLEIYPTFLDKIALYEPVSAHRDKAGSDEKIFMQKNAGRTLPLQSRDVVSANNPLFALKLSNNEPITYFIRIQTTSTLFADIKIWNPDSYSSYSDRVSLLLGGFYGTLFLLAVFNLVFWIALRDRLFGIYCIFLLSLGFSLMPGSGVTDVYLFPQAPTAAYLLNGISIACVLITGSLMIEALIPLGSRSIWRISFVSIRVFAAFCIVMVIAGQFRLIAAPLMFSGLYLSLACVIVSLIGIYKRVPMARLYGVTFIIYYLGGVMITLRNTNLLGFSAPYMDNMFQIGTYIHMILIQIAIGYRFRNIEKERQENQKKMEAGIVRAQKIESLAVLAGGIAHDFNNMLTVIMSTVTLAKMYAKDNTGTVGKLIEAEKEIIRARELTNQLLTFAKGGAPVKRLSSPADLVRDTVEFSMKGSEIKYSVAIDYDLWSAEIDKVQISQVVSNLVINSKQAMQNGGILLVEASNTVLDKKSALPLPQGRYVKITVKDNGVGIEPENIEKIFVPFFSTKPHGSGLGLSSSYSIVKKHNGYIEVMSTPGKGSIFSVYLPASSDFVSDESHNSNYFVNGSGRLLLMDDEEGLRNNVCEMLSELGYNVDVSSNGTQAVMMYKKALESGAAFDAVILDLTVAGEMGGRECMEELVKIDPSVKAVVMSGYSEDAVLADYEQYGFRCSIPKPFTIEELSAALMKARK